MLYNMLRLLAKIDEMQTTEIIDKITDTLCQKSPKLTNFNDIERYIIRIYNNIKYLYKYSIYTITSVTCVTRFFPVLDIGFDFFNQQGIILRLQRLHFLGKWRSIYKFNNLQGLTKILVTCVTLKRVLNWIIESFQWFKVFTKNTIKTICYKICNLDFRFVMISTGYKVTQIG